MINRIIEWWNARQERRRATKAEYNKESVAQKAQEMFQICEHNNGVWLTLDGRLVCPIAFFSETDPVVVVNAIRKLYIKENEGK